MTMNGSCVLAPLLLGLAVFHLGVGLKVYESDKPIILPLRYRSYAALLVFLPTVVILVTSLIVEFDAFVAYFLVPSQVVPAAMVVWMWMMKGYQVFGVTDETFRRALRHSLERLKLSYKETQTGIRVMQGDVNLEISVSSLEGTVAIRPKDSGDNPLLQDIITSMSCYYSESDINAKNRTLLVYLGVGLFCLVLSLYHFRICYA